MSACRTPQSQVHMCIYVDWYAFYRASLHSPS